METTVNNPNPAPIASQPIQSGDLTQPVSTGMSQDTKIIIVVLLLIFVYPIGIILMFVWMKWPWWVKLLVALPTTLIFLTILGMVAAGMLAAINPQAQIARASDAKSRNTAMEIATAVERYYAENGTYPWGEGAGYQSANVSTENWMTKLTGGGDLANSFVMNEMGTTKFALKQSMTGEVQVCFDSMSVKQVMCVP